MSTEQDTFRALFNRHRRELTVHCYRLLGSFTETEDLLQETFLRAWKHRADVADEAARRAWLYRVATNACLDALRERKRRVLPPDVMPPIGPENPAPRDPSEFDWVEPIPDSLLVAGPDEATLTRESVGLAFLAAIQHLTPVQRAVLLLRDSLGWPAKETADALGTTEAAVKSALQRARAVLVERLPGGGEPAPPSAAVTAAERDVLRRYIDAFQRDDAAALAAVLREDVRVSYPSAGLWCDSAEAFIQGSKQHAPPGEYRFIATSANLQPAVAIYLRPPGEALFRLTALEVLRVEGDRVAEVVDYDLSGREAAYGLPATLRE